MQEEPNARPSGDLKIRSPPGGVGSIPTFGLRPRSGIAASSVALPVDEEATWYRFLEPDFVSSPCRSSLLLLGDRGEHRLLAVADVAAERNVRDQTRAIVQAPRDAPLEVRVEQGSRRPECDGGVAGEDPVTVEAAGAEDVDEIVAVEGTEPGG